MFKRSQLMKFCTSIFIYLGMDDEKANDTSDILIEADMMGHSTHGVRLLPLYIKDIEMGNMKTSGQEDVLKDLGSSISQMNKN
ncbi:MAG: Ldh family oxidoreductase, partial [Alphaproteobacteria bacterium]|nr:Ldh family oxidoreductase [Alphaproteobacteria bacterium]